MNQLWVKIVGVHADIDLEKFPVPPEVHGGTGWVTVKQLIMYEATYIKENGIEYRILVSKIQRMSEGGGWQITGKNRRLET